MPPKRRKGRGGDSDEDPLASQLAYLKAQAEMENADVDTPTPPVRDIDSGLSKKDKKKTKGGKQQLQQDDILAAAPAAAAAAAAGDTDDQAAIEESRPTYNMPTSNRKGKKGNTARDSSDDDEEETGRGKKQGKAVKKDKGKKGKGKGGASATIDSDDDQPVPASVANKSGNKKGQRKKGGRRGGDSSSEEDIGDKGDAEEEEPSMKAAELAVASGGGKKLSKKEKKKAAAKKAGGRARHDSNEDVDALQLMMKKLGAAADSEEEEVEEEEEGKEEEEKNKAEEERQRQQAAQDKAKAEEEAAVAAAVVAAAAKKAEKEAAAAEKKKKEEEAAATAAAVKKAEEAAATAAAAEKKQKEEEAAAAAAVAKKKAEEEAAAAAAAAAAAPAKKPAKKSKLELKLEEAKRKKAEADAIAAAKAAEEEKTVEAAAAAAAEKLQAERQAAQELVGPDSSAAVPEKDKPSSSSTASADASTGATTEDRPQTQEEIEREMRMHATMFGDEVQADYMKPGGPQYSGDEDESYGKSKNASRSANRLSSKAKRKEAQASERKEREKEYNLAALKASAEGAQFACSQSIVAKDDPQWNNALDIIIPSFSISAHNKELFVNSELSIVHGRRYGLVAPNGAGKSTLLKMIAAGELKVPPRVDYLYVEQEVIADETPAVDAVLKADKVRWELVQEEKQLLAELDRKADESKDVRLGEVHEQLAQINASSAESRARRILFGLGFDAEMQTRPTKYFSGGWRMRISLARALFIEPTLLMLDEPTNHLDLNAVIWLDDYLQKWKKTLLVVSHDQDFLNSVCQEILHLDQKHINTYRGNYDTFKEQEATKRRQLMKEWEKQEKRLREMKAKGITKENAEKAQLKSKTREPGARGSKKKEADAVVSGGMESAASQVKLIERPREYVVRFSFPEVSHVPPPILEVRDVNFRYGPKLPWLFRGLNFGLDMGSRVCIVGPNGSGKSTIIKLITEEVKPPEGEVYRNPRLRVGVYNQHFMDRLPMEEDAVTYLRRLFSTETYQSCRNLLGKYGLEGHAHCIPIRDLSGGQKARVVFVELSLMAPHLLFLDEPTNNLDIESIDALCDALREYNGGVVLVSHDARLIETIEAQLWVVDDQNVTPWASGFNGYRTYLLNKLEEQLAAIMPGSGERPT